MAKTSIAGSASACRKAAKDQVKIIGTLCRKIIHQDFIHQLRRGDADQVFALLNQTLSS